MSRVKLILLGGFAVLALGAVGASSASAACSGGTQSVFCLGSNNEEIHEELVLGESGLSLLASKVGANELKIHCKDDLFHGTIELLGKSKGVIEFLSCTVVEPAANCGVNQPIVAKFTDQLSKEAMPATDLFTGSGTGKPEEFAIITITGASCAIPAASYTVLGLQTAELPFGETSLVEHEIVAKKSGSKLKLGNEPASFSSTAKVHLGSGASWLVMLGI